jgi:hypothetical protein
MKFVFSVLLAFVGAQAFAMDVTVDCSPKFYACTLNSCSWQAQTAVPSTRVVLTKDPNYPNKDYPFEIYRGTFRANYDNHVLTLDILYRDAVKSKPLTVHAMLSTTTVAAETSGTDSIDVSLRNGNYGRGFNCEIN